MSSAVAIGTFLLVACFIMQCVGVATDYWMVVSVFTGSVKSHAGLFKMCYEVLSVKSCVLYITYSETFRNIHYFGIVGCSCLGTLLLFIACIIGFCGCSNPNPKSTIQNISGVGLFGGLFCSAGAGWYFLYFLQGTFGDVSSILANFGVDMGPGWSFYLCCAAGGASLILSIILMVIGCNMPSNNGMVAPLQPTTVIAVSGGQMQHQHPPTAHNMQNPAYNDPFDPNPKQGFY